MKGRFRFFSFRHRKPVRVLVATLGGLILLLTVGLSALYATVTAGLPDINQLDHYEPAETSKIVASDGTLIATMFDQNRTYTPFNKIAPVMISALVAIEDRRFFEHDGVDLTGIARAVVGNATAGGTEQGASTLTMQLARRLFLSDERTYTRKMREAVLAYRLDHELSKQKILELYLNEVYFGAGAYGVDAAAGQYFGKDPDKLDLWQAALLAGLVQAPTRYSPMVDRKAALERLDQVLDAMQKEGKATPGQVKQAREKAAAYKFPSSQLANPDGLLKFPYFTSYVIHQLSDQFPDTYLKRGGLEIVTSLDVRLQEAAERALSQALKGPARDLGADTGAVVVIDNATGQLVAMVGGPGWSAKKQYNAAWQARRQPGSSFKMFIYAAALEAGYTPESEFADTKATFSPGRPEQWQPENSDGSFMGAIPLRTGLQFSRNLVSAKVIAHLGPQRVIRLAQAMGIDSELPPYASLALGAGEVTPLQMARAYSALPTGGLLRPAGAIKLVSTKDGVLKDNTKGVEEDRVLSQDTATQMCEMLRRVVTGGTAQGANLQGTYVAGKTGTTDNFKDAWFIGFTPHHTIAVWIGRDDNKPMAQVFGGTIPADIFHTVAKAALQGKDAGAPLPGVKFTERQTAKLCYDSTYLATPTCPRTYEDVFQAGVVPERTCPNHRQVKVPASVATMSNVRPQGDPALSRSTPAQVELSTANIPDNLNPRKDPEVVGPEHAEIPYTEQPPSLAGVRFLIEGAPRTAPVTKKPGEVDATIPGGEDESLTPSDSAAPPPLTNESGAPLTAEQDPALSTGSARQTQAGGTATSATLEVDPGYPQAGVQPADVSSQETIYESDVEVPPAGEAQIPPDTGE